ncbi:hypothetical protein ACWDTD_07735 [Gordonia sp. NPDC003425]
MRAIAASLEHDGMLTGSGAATWHANAVRRVLDSTRARRSPPPSKPTTPITAQRRPHFSSQPSPGFQRSGIVLAHDSIVAWTVARWTQIRTWCVTNWPRFWRSFRDYVDAPLARISALVSLVVVAVPVIGWAAHACQPSGAGDQAVRSIGARMLDAADKRFATELRVEHNGTVAVRIVYRNTAASTASGVQVSVTIPGDLAVVTTDVKILNANNPGGAVLDDSSVAPTNTGFSAAIGSYTPGSNALIVFPVTLRNPALLSCGYNSLTIRAQFRDSATQRTETDEVTLIYEGLTKCN